MTAPHPHTTPHTHGIGSRRTGRDVSQAAMRYVTNREKSQGAIVAHLMGLGYSSTVSVGVIDTLIRRRVILQDGYGRCRLDPALMEWRKVRAGVTRDGRAWWKRWNGERFEQVLSERPTKPNPPSPGAKRAIRAGEWRPPSRHRHIRCLNQQTGDTQ